MMKGRNPWIVDSHRKLAVRKRMIAFSRLVVRQISATPERRLRGVGSRPPSAGSSTIEDTAT